MPKEDGMVVMFDEVLSLVRLVFGVEGSDDRSFQPRRMGGSSCTTPSTMCPPFLRSVHLI
jgi:hypothetical protein